MQALMIQTFCLAQQNAGDWDWMEDEAAWAFKYSQGWVYLTDDGFAFAHDEEEPTPIKSLSHLRELISSTYPE